MFKVIAMVINLHFMAISSSVYFYTSVSSMFSISRVNLT